MAVAVQDAITEVDRVSEAVLDSYHRRRELVTQVPLAEFVEVTGAVGALRATVASGERAVEIALDAEVDAGALAPTAWRLTSRGWQVVVLVALDRIGEAHVGLRGVPCRLQPWWLDATGVSFGAFEIP